MLKINIIAIGKIKESYFKDAINEYLKRLKVYAKVSITELPECPLTASNNESIIKDKESETLLKAASGYVILLDIEGNNLKSDKLSQMIQAITSIKSEISFIIGGSHGVNDMLRKKADYVLSFGNNTYPHQLMRVILCEQIYRSFMIMANTPYHK